MHWLTSLPIAFIHLITHSCIHWKHCGVASTQIENSIWNCQYSKSIWFQKVKRFIWVVILNKLGQQLDVWLLFVCIIYDSTLDESFNIDPMNLSSRIRILHSRARPTRNVHLHFPGLLEVVSTFIKAISSGCDAVENKFHRRDSSSFISSFQIDLISFGQECRVNWTHRRPQRDSIQRPSTWVSAKWKMKWKKFKWNSPSSRFEISKWRKWIKSDWSKARIFHGMFSHPKHEKAC